MPGPLNKWWCCQLWHEEEATTTPVALLLPTKTCSLGMHQLHRLQSITFTRFWRMPKKQSTSALDGCNCVSESHSRQQHNTTTTPNHARTRTLPLCPASHTPLVTPRYPPAVSPRISCPPTTALTAPPTKTRPLPVATTNAVQAQLHCVQTNRLPQTPTCVLLHCTPPPFPS